MIPVDFASLANGCECGNYRDRLYCWQVVQLLPQMQRAIVAKFRQRHQAEECLRVLRRLQTDSQFVIVFNAHLGAKLPALQ